MIDLSLNENFSVHLNDKHGLATVDGRDEFEQSVSVALTDYIHSSSIGEFDFSTISQKIRLTVSRVARKHDRLNGVSRVDVKRDDDKPNTYQVRIVYESDEVFSMRISN